MDAIRLHCGRSLKLASVLLLVFLAMSVATARELRDVPVVWFDDDKSDIPIPEERDPSLHWDEINDTVMLPFARLLNPARLIRQVGTLFGGDRVSPASNVNTLDEVPNSSWFTNRIGLFHVTPEQAARGAGTGRGPDRSEKWTVVSAKTQGVTPGFNIRDANGDVYLIKFDPPGFPGLTTGAGVISSRILYAVGYNVPDDAIVMFLRDDLVLGKGVKLKLQDGSKRAMKEEDLDEILDSVDRMDDGRIRAISSKFVDGRPIGPFDYAGRRKDDPNDRIKHQDRRELRALRIFAAWLAHFDTKQHNSLDAFVTEGGKSFVRHHLIDFASTLGSGAYGPCPRYSFEYFADFAALLRRILFLGLREDAWRRIARPEGLDQIGFFEAEEFDPIKFKPLQPNTAFANLTNRDGYWAAKIMSSFSEAHLEAIVEQARYGSPEATRYMTRTLGERRDKITRKFFDLIPPLDFFVVRNGKIEFHDLGVERAVYPGVQTRYRYRVSLVKANRSPHGWTEWFELTDTVVALSEQPIAELMEPPHPEQYPFLALSIQLNRGTGWSSSTKVYQSLKNQRIVALER